MKDNSFISSSRADSIDKLLQNTYSYKGENYSPESCYVDLEDKIAQENYVKNQENFRTIFKLKNSMSLPKGNFYFPIKDNIDMSNNLKKEFFFRNYGDENIDLVNKAFDNTERIFEDVVQKENESNGFNQVLTEDLVTNWIILQILIIKNETNKGTLIERNEKVRKYYYETLQYYKDLNFPKFFGYLERLMGRYSVRPNFWHLSCIEGCQKDGNMNWNYNKIIITFKSFYCAICLVYNCNKHLIKDEDYCKFDNPEKYDFKYEAKTFSEFNNYMDFNKCFMNLNINQKKLNFNKYENSILNISPTVVCSNLCYKNTENIMQNLNVIFINKASEKIFDLYFDKLVEIFKFDPCMISKTLNSLFFRKDYFDCTFIAIRISNGSITDYLKKCSNNKLMKKKKKMINQLLLKKRLEIIKKLSSESKII